VSTLPVSTLPVSTLPDLGRELAQKRSSEANQVTKGELGRAGALQEEAASIGTGAIEGTEVLMPRSVGWHGGHESPCGDASVQRGRWKESRWRHWTHREMGLLDGDGGKVGEVAANREMFGRKRLAAAYGLHAHDALGRCWRACPGFRAGWRCEDAKFRSGHDEVSIHK
jgi:hypothetical protein